MLEQRATCLHGKRFENGLTGRAGRMTHAGLNLPYYKDFTSPRRMFGGCSAWLIFVDMAACSKGNILMPTAAAYKRRKVPFLLGNYLASGCKRSWKLIVCSCGCFEGFCDNFCVDFYALLCKIQWSKLHHQNVRKPPHEF